MISAIATIFAIINPKASLTFRMKTLTLKEMRSFSVHV